MTTDLERAARAALPLLQQYINEAGPCDHSVNICICGLISTTEDLGHALRALPPAREWVSVPRSTIERIAFDCEHGSRIWKECQAILSPPVSTGDTGPFEDASTEAALRSVEDLLPASDAPPPDWYEKPPWNGAAPAGEPPVLRVPSVPATPADGLLERAAQLLTEAACDDEGVDGDAAMALIREIQIYLHGPDVIGTDLELPPLRVPSPDTLPEEPPAYWPSECQMYSRQFVWKEDYDALRQSAARLQEYVEAQKHRAEAAERESRELYDSWTQEQGKALAAEATVIRLQGELAKRAESTLEMSSRAEAAERTVEALIPYVRHTKHCRLTDPNDERSDCTCGLDKLLLSAARKEGT